MKTGKRTPRAKLNPTERIMHIAVKKQINHDQILSCLYEDNFSQHSSMITVSICFGVGVTISSDIWSADNYISNSVTQWLVHFKENVIVCDTTLFCFRSLFPFFFTFDFNQLLFYF